MKTKKVRQIKRDKKMKNKVAKKEISNINTTTTNVNVTEKVFQETVIPFSVSEAMILDEEFLSGEKTNKRKFYDLEEETKNLNEIVDLTEAAQFSFEEENLNKILIESLVNNEIPNEIKEKINIIKKFITHFKKIRNDEFKLTHFLQKISSIFGFSLNNSKLILEYEMHKLKREGIFSNFSKVLNKCIIYLTDNNIREFGEKILNNSEIKDKLVSVMCKGITYVESIASVMYISIII